MASIRDIWMSANNLMRTSRQWINRELRPLGLGSMEGNIFLHLLVVGEPLYQEQLAAQLDITKAAISRAVDALEDSGYLVREKSGRDRRLTRLRLTDAALAVAPRVERIYDGIYQKATAGISRRELETLLGLLRRVADNIASDSTKENE